MSFLNASLLPTGFRDHLVISHRHKYQTRQAWTMSVVFSHKKIAQLSEFQFHAIPVSASSYVHLCRNLTSRNKKYSFRILFVFSSYSHAHTDLFLCGDTWNIGIPVGTLSTVAECSDAGVAPSTNTALPWIPSMAWDPNSIRFEDSVRFKMTTAHSAKPVTLLAKLRTRNMLRLGSAVIWTMATPISCRSWKRSLREERYIFVRHTLRF